MTDIRSTDPARRARPVAARAPRHATIAPQGAPTRSTATSFLAGARNAGGMSVKERFATLEQRFKPEAATGVDVKLQFSLSGPDGGDWYVVIKDGKIKVKPGTGPGADATLKASAEDYLKIADGEMSKTWAFLRGKLKIDGDKDKIKPFDTWFEKP